MTFAWSEFLDIARFLQSEGANNSIPQEAAYRCAISRAYYSAFCHSRCYASARLQFNPTWTDDDHRILRHHLWNRGMQTESQNLDRLRQWRNDCDYHNYPSVSSYEHAFTNLYDQICTIYRASNFIFN